MRIRRSLVAVVVGAVAAGATTPASAQPTPPPGGSGSVSAAATQSIVHAARTEAAAHLQYNAYANVLSGAEGGLMETWQAVGRVEDQDHLGHQMDRIKMFTNNPAHDLQVAITAYQQTIGDEQAILGRVPKGADVSELRDVADRHKKDLALLQNASSALRGGRAMPAAPKVETVDVKKAHKPKFTGPFYDKDLTGDANSVLADAAWNGAVADRVSRTAVDNGQAGLAGIMGALQRQETEQNWPAVSNMAGYVGSAAANLKASIAGEKGAITMYGQYASHMGGDAAVAEMFKEFQADEKGHLKVFSDQLSRA